MPKRSGRDKTEGAIDKATGRAKEATGSLTGSKARKAEGRAEQDTGTLKKKKGAVKDLLKGQPHAGGTDRGAVTVPASPHL